MKVNDIISVCPVVALEVAIDAKERIIVEVLWSTGEKSMLALMPENADHLQATLADALAELAERN